MKIIIHDDGKERYSQENKDSRLWHTHCRGTIFITISLYMIYMSFHRCIGMHGPESKGDGYKNKNTIKLNKKLLWDKYI